MITLFSTRAKAYFSIPWNLTFTLCNDASQIIKVSEWIKISQLYCAVKPAVAQVGRGSEFYLSGVNYLSISFNHLAVCFAFIVSVLENSCSE